MANFVLLPYLVKAGLSWNHEENVLLPSHSSDLLYIRVSRQKSDLAYVPIIGGQVTNPTHLDYFPHLKRLH